MSVDPLLAAGNPLGEISRTFGVTWQLFISNLIAFLIVAWLLKKFAYQPVLDVLEERRQRIATSIKNSETIKRELAKTETARKDILQNANEQATQIIEDARAAAARVQEQETQKAVVQAEQIVHQARETSAADRERLLAELKREVGQLVVKTTTQVVGKVLSPEDQRRLIQEANKELVA